jgi:uncharacterized membrane protein
MRPLTKLQTDHVVLGFVFLWFFVGGIAHFTLTSLEMRIVPPWIPWPRDVVLLSGVFELCGAFGVLFKPTRRLAGFGLFALTIAVTPANLYMLQHPNLFGIPYWVLVLRLPLQLLLLYSILWSTRIRHLRPMAEVSLARAVPRVLKRRRD